MRLLQHVVAAAAAAVALAGAPAIAARVELWWDVGHVRINRDGLGARNAVGVNGTLPVPAVHITEGDTLVLHVHNSLSVTTSIHAHGIFQTGTPFMDGAAMVSQCGIPPNASFTYEYTVHQAGTYWLHGHDHHQNVDGLRTPLIVHDKCPPAVYDGEDLLAFEDWYASEFASRVAVTMDPKLPFPPVPSYPTLLINGIADNATHPLRFAPGSTRRLRLINMATTEWVRFVMPGHQLLVLEADGVYTDPLPATTLTLGPGQRYSVLVTAHNSTALNYQFHVALYASFVPVQNTTNPRRYTGLVEYRAGAPLATAATVAGFDSRADLMPLGAHSDVQLRTAHRREALPVDRSIPLVLSGNLYDDGITRDVVNNMTYAAPLVPSLYSALTMGALATDPAVYGPQPGAIVLRSGEHIELVVSNPNSLPHPMHLHGHVFQLIEYGPVDKQLLQVPATVLDRITVQRYTGWPMERDTMVVPKYSYATIRFTANNPGVWLLHCHMDIHFAMGMAVTFIEAPDVLQQTTRVPPEMLQLCTAQGIPVHGNAAGNNGLNLTGLPPPPHIAANQTGAPLH